MNLPDLLVRLYKLGVRNAAMRAVQLTSNSMATGWREKKKSGHEILLTMKNSFLNELIKYNKSQWRQSLWIKLRYTGFWEIIWSCSSDKFIIYLYLLIRENLQLFVFNCIVKRLTTCECKKEEKKKEKHPWFYNQGINAIAQRNNQIKDRKKKKRKSNVQKI